MNTKQQAQETYVRWALDELVSGEPIILKVINKINWKLKFLYWKNKFLTSELRRILCNCSNHTEKYKLCKLNEYGFVLD